MNKKKGIIIAAAAAVVLVAVVLILIFVPKGGSGGDSEKATIDEGVALTVSTDKNGAHQAIVGTKNNKIENNSYATLLE